MATSRINEAKLNFYIFIQKKVFSFTKDAKWLEKCSQNISSLSFGYQVGHTDTNYREALLYKKIKFKKA